MRPRNEHRSWSLELVSGIFQNTICTIYDKVYYIITIVDRFSSDFGTTIPICNLLYTL